MGKLISPLDACKVDLLSDEEEVRAKYAPQLAERVLRLRAVYNYWLANPSMVDRELKDMIMQEYGTSQATAYADIAIVHQLTPLISKKSKDFHTARANEMLMETYALAKKNGDIKTMERTVTSYWKMNGCDKEEEQAITFENVAVQPFTASEDPALLGIKPIPNLNNYIAKLIKDLSRDFPDVTDVDFEEVDLEEEFIFPDIADDTDKS